MPRLEFAASTKRQAFARSGGVCECHIIPRLRRPLGCGAKLGVGNIFYEHIEPDNIRHDNSLDNCACLSKTCWREKTDTYDRKVIAKSNHVRDGAQGIRQHFYKPLPGTKRSNIRKPMKPYSKPVWRDSGRPVF